MIKVAVSVIVLLSRTTKSVRYENLQIQESIIDNYDLKF